MSPMRKPSSVDAITRAAAIPPKGDPVLAELEEEARREREEHAKRARPPKPVRVTLNIPPDVYRDFLRWCDRQAVALDVPRVGIQPALRAAMRATAADSPEMLNSYLRYELAGKSDEA